MPNSQTLEQAAQSVTKNSPQNKPSAESVVIALLESEKAAKKTKQSYPFENLIGTWRLCFITGTKKTRQKAGIVMGSGRYLPSWVTIQLSYSRVPDSSITSEAYEVGQMNNNVKFSSLQFSLTGPAKFLKKNNILAFDFTRMSVQLFGAKLYEGYIRGGKNSEEKFYEEPVGKQAFFAFFLVSDEAIAARGRGGGLALWGRDS